MPLAPLAEAEVSVQEEEMAVAEEVAAWAVEAPAGEPELRHSRRRSRRRLINRLQPRHVLWTATASSQQQNQGQ